MRCGGPDDARLAGNMVRFPRPNEPDAEAVTVRGPSEVVSKIVAELSAFAGDMQSRIVYGVHVPQSAHAAIIGRGAAALRELQTRHNVRVIIPGWKEYDGAGPVVNADEVADAPQGEVIKIAGKREAAEACATELRSKSVAGSSSGGGAGGISRTVEVPRRHHAFIAQGGRFFRSLPRGTRISHGSVRPPQGGARRTGPPPPPPVATNGSSAPAARIDDDDVDLSEPDDLTFQLEPITSDEDDSSVPWIIESSSQENVDKVAEQVEAELAKASLKTHQAWITVPRSSSESAQSLPRCVAASLNQASSQCRGLLAAVALVSTGYAHTASTQRSSGAATRTSSTCLARSRASRPRTRPWSRFHAPACAKIPRLSHSKPLDHATDERNTSWNITRN